MKAPRGWDEVAQSAWNAGRKGDAVGRMMAVVGRSDVTPALALQAVFYLFTDGHYPPAREILEQAAARFPDDHQILLNLAVLQSRMHDHAAAKPTLERYLAAGGDDAGAADGLAIACHKLGDDAAARDWGTRSIEQKSAEAAANAPVLTLGEPRAEGADIIAFSLWGDHSRYLRGALHNAVRAALVYPGWTCRFWVDDSVPVDLLTALDAQGAELVREAGQPSQRHRLTRRFLAADDPGVRRYLVRDCDSLVNAREAAAVAAWIDSGKPFHAMRDWWTHTDPLLAGLWGGAGGVLPPLAPLLAAYHPRTVETANWDQWFLRDTVWPSIRGETLVHDRCFRSAGSRPFPAPDPPGNLHVGQNEYAVRQAEQAAELARFANTVPSLRL